MLTLAADFPSLTQRAAANATLPLGLAELFVGNLTARELNSS